MQLLIGISHAKTLLAEIGMLTQNPHSSVALLIDSLGSYSPAKSAFASWYESPPSTEFPSAPKTREGEKSSIEIWLCVRWLVDAEGDIAQVQEEP